jgi:RNA polymerase sigma-70 factor (ECF subfamily)
MLKTDQDSLIQATLAGDPQAFQALIEPHAPGVYGLALQITRSPVEAEEVLQDAMLTAYAKLNTFRGASSFKTWLYRIATNAALMRLRKAKRAPESLPENWEKPADPRPWTGDPEAWFAREEFRQILNEALDSLPEIYRTTFWLRDVEGLGNQEVAEIMGLSLPAVKSRILRARLHLRDQLAPYFEERLRDAS